MKNLYAFKNKWLVIALGMLLHCSGIGVGSGDATVVQLKVVSDLNSTEIGNALLVNDIVFNKAKIVLSEMKFNLSSNCEEETEDFGFQGPFIVDLLKQQSTPSLEDVTLPAGLYCKFKFKLDKLEDDELPTGIESTDEMVDLSVLIEGESDGVTPFVVKLDQDQEFEMNSNDDAGFELDPALSATLFLVFGLHDLFDDVDISTLDQIDGTVYIDKDNNEEAYDIIKENLKNFSKLQKDSDDDSDLDESDDEVADEGP